MFEIQFKATTQATARTEAAPSQSSMIVWLISRRLPPFWRVWKYPNRKSCAICGASDNTREPVAGVQWKSKCMHRTPVNTQSREWSHPGLRNSLCDVISINKLLHKTLDWLLLSDGCSAQGPFPSAGRQKSAEMVLKHIHAGRAYQFVCFMRVKQHTRSIIKSEVGAKTWSAGTNLQVGQAKEHRRTHTHDRVSAQWWSIVCPSWPMAVRCLSRWISNVLNRSE